MDKPKEETAEEKARYNLKVKQAEDKILKAKIKLQSKSPFFSYLAFFLKIKRADKRNLLGTKTMSVDVTGNLYYNPDWICKLPDDEVMGVVVHEISHLAFLHLLRRKNREPEKWNIAIDLATNGILIKNGFSLPKDGLIPDYNDNFEFPLHTFGKKVRVENVHKKTAEEIFDILPEPKEDDGNSGGRGFDTHIEGKGSGDKDGDGNGKGSGSGSGSGTRQLTPAELKDLEEKWRDRIEDALMNSRARGNVPLGMERAFEELRKSQIPWRVLLERIIQKAVPRDITWARRSKKSIACKTYLPSILKERVDVVISIDTSGSIGQKELTDFVSEIVGMARAFQSSINMRILTHDVDVHDDLEIRNGNIDKIKCIKVKGGGGTSHQPVFDYVKEKVRDCKTLIAFTDGFSDLDYFEWNNNEYPFEKVFVLNKEGSDEQMQNKRCKVIKMKE